MGIITLSSRINKSCTQVKPNSKLRDLDINRGLIYLLFIVYLDTPNIRKNVLYLELLDAKLHNWLLCHITYVT